MNLYGWDLLFATKLSVINAAFQRNSAALASSFNFTSNDPVFGVTVTISGTFGSWSLAGKGSNSLIQVVLPVSGLTVSTSMGPSINNASCTVTVELDLTFISDKTNPNKQNLVFDYSDNGDSTGNKKISVAKVDPGSTPMNQNQIALAGQAVVSCLAAHPDTLNYIFASALLKNEQADWLSPDNIAFDMPTLSNGDTYFCIFGTTGPKAGQTGQVDPVLFNSTDTMYLGISGPMFLERVVMPGLKAAMHGASIVFANPQIIVSGFNLPGCKAGLITYYPVITHMTLKISGNKIITSLNGVCDLKADISMSFTRSSQDTIVLNSTTRTISIVPDPSPSFSHNEDLGFWKYIVVLPIGAIATGIAAIIATVVGNAIANSVNQQSSAQFVFKTQSITWSNTDFNTIHSGGVSDNFFLTGIAQ